MFASVLGMTADHIGALLVGIGAILLLVDAFSGPGLNGMTFGGTLAEPGRRLSSGAEIAGSLLVAIGSGLLLFASSGVDARAVIVTVAIAAAIIYLVMTARLREHLNLVARTEDTDQRTWWWCARHPRWRPRSRQRLTQIEMGHVRVRRTCDPGRKP